MTAAIPRTDAEELAIQLSRMCEAQTRIDQLTSQRLKRDIEKAKARDAKNAFVARGLLALLEWDLPGIRSSFEAALPLGGMTETLEQYATTLQMIGDYPGACDQIEKAFSRSRTDLQVVNKTINFSFLAGRYTRAREVCDMYDLLRPTDPHEERLSIEQAIAVLKISGGSEAMVEECNRIAFELLRERRVVFNETTSEADELDGMLFLTISVCADEALVEELDAELGERLFDRVEGYNPNRYWVGYSTRTTKAISGVRVT